MKTLPWASHEHLITRCYKAVIILQRVFSRVCPLLAADFNLPFNFIYGRLNKTESVIFYTYGENGDGIGFTQRYPSLCSVAAKRRTGC